MSRKAKNRATALRRQVLTHPAAMQCVADVQIVASAEGVEPALATFEAVAYTGAPMRIAGYRYPVIIDLQGFQAPKQTMPALRDHEFGKVVGHTTEIVVTATGVRVRGVISGASEAADEVRSAAKNGFPWQVSLGSVPEPGQLEFVAAGKTAVVNGRTVTGPHYIARRAVMHEFTFTPLGADRNTSAAIAATFSGATDMNFEEWLKAQGFDLAVLTATQKATLQAAFDASKQDDGDEPIQATAKPAEIQAMISKAVEDATAKAVEATTQKMQADLEIQARLSQVCVGHPSILAKAKAEKWSIDKAELEVERANRPRPVFSYGSQEGAPNTADVIEAALCVNAGSQTEFLKKNFDEKVVNAAMERRLRGFGMHALMYEVIRAAGRYVSPGIIGDALIRNAFEADREIKASGVSNVSLASTLGAVVNKFAVAGFNSVEQTWAKISSIGSVSDFKAITGHRLTGDFTYEQVGQDGELKHAEMGETTYTNQAKTYGKIFGITRQTLINDDMGFVESTARLRLGRGAGLKLNNVFWTEFMNNSSFFASGNSNYFEGAATNLQISSLTTAAQMFLLQTDENGDPLNLTPAILLVPPALDVLAKQIFADTAVRDTTASTKYTTGNPHQGMFRPETSTYLQNSAYTGYSATAFYLLCDPNELGVGVIQTVFLNGKREPTVESSELDFDQLGIQMRGYHDFGVTKQEKRCGVKSKGAA